MALIKIQRFFGAVPNDLLNNPDISFKAKGLYAYLNSKPDNWDFSVEGIAAQVKEGIDSVRAGIHELEKFGYLKRIKHQDEKGYWDVDYMLFEVPVEHESYLGKSNEGKHPKQYKKEYTKKDYTKKEIYKEKSPLPLFPTNNGNEKQDEHSRGGGGGPAAERFHKPTMEEVAEYVSSKYPSASKQSVESFAERFWSHYENKDWKYGKGIKMKNWKLALPQWKDTIEKELTSQTTVLSGKLNATISANNNLKFNIK